MSGKRKRRGATRISLRRWSAYASAAAATFACSPSAEADIHVVEADVLLVNSAPPNGYFQTAYSFSFGVPGVNVFFWRYTYPPGYSQGILVAGARLTASAPSSFSARIAGTSYGGRPRPSVYRLNYGSGISSRQMLPSSTVGNVAWGFGTSFSYWPDNDGYLAFQFDVGHGTQYGWAELSLVSGTPLNEYRLERYAWADPGESLFAGQVPEAGSLGLLALGALGLVAWRHRRSDIPFQV
ncbi:MAG: PEP-CTERM sorting domain-containing protein [Planctomycetota bacterium]